MSKLQRLSRGAKIKYPLLSDENSDIIRAFGLLAANYAPGSFYPGIPHPAIVVIDADGVVSHRFSEQRYTDRPETDDVLAALKRDAGS